MAPKIFRGAVAFFSLGTLVLFGAAAPRPTPESLQERRERVAAMTPQQKAELHAKQELFGRLEPKERDRIRKLHREIEADPNGERLKAVMLAYRRLMDAVPAVERASLADMPHDDRLKEISGIVAKRREEELYRSIREALTDKDRERIKAWLEETFRSLEESDRKFSEKVAPHLSPWARHSPFPDARKTDVVRVLLEQSQPSLPRISEERLESLFNLSPKAKEIASRADTPEARRSLALTLIRTSFFYHRLGDDELRQFERQITATDNELKNQLDGLAYREWRDRLWWEYARKNPRPRFGGMGRPEGNERNEGEGGNRELRLWRRGPGFGPPGSPPTSRDAEGSRRDEPRRPPP